MRPASFRTRETPSVTERSSRTSMETAATESSPVGALLEAPKTRKPAAASNRALAFPIPEDAPVTRITCCSVKGSLPITLETVPDKSPLFNRQHCRGSPGDPVCRHGKRITTFCRDEKGRIPPHSRAGRLCSMLEPLGRRR